MRTTVVLKDDLVKKAKELSVIDFECPTEQLFG